MQKLYGGVDIDWVHFPAVFALLAMLSLSSALWFMHLTPASGIEILGGEVEEMTESSQP